MTQPEYPEKGLPDWDDELKEYIDGADDTVDPDDDQTITGTWDFRSTAPYVGAYFDIIAAEQVDPYGPVPDSGIRYSVDEAAHDNLFLVGHTAVDPVGGLGVTSLTIFEENYAGSPPTDPPTTTFTVILPTTGGSGVPTDIIPTTADEVIAAFNASVAAGRVTAARLTGHNGTGDTGLQGIEFLRRGVITPHVEITEGAITSPVTIHPDELFETPLTLRAALGSTLGTAVLNVEHPDGAPNDNSGYGVAHIDSDGGGGFSGDKFRWSQDGRVVIDSTPGAPVLDVQREGFGVLQAGADYAALVVTSSNSDQRTFSVNGYTAQTADLVEAYRSDPYDLVFRVTPDGEVHALGGVVLTSPNGTAYRIVVANDGSLSTEAV